MVKNSSLSDTERLAMYVIHDIEPAIASFQSVVGLMQKKRLDPDNPMHQRLLTSCDAALSFSKYLLQDMLEYSRMAHGKVTPVPVLIQWDLFFEEAMAIPLLQSSINDINLEWKISNSKTKFYTDRILVWRIIQNLTLNAVKNSSPGSNIFVSNRFEGNNVLIDIMDQGPGIPEDKLEDIFKIHEQLHLRDQGLFKGAGIGLSFCKRTCELLNGSLHLKNIKPHGLCFTVKLPNMRHND